MKKKFYFLSILILFLINISIVNALENNNQVYFYNNNGDSVNSVSTNYDTNTGESSAIFTTYANSYGGLMVYQLSSPLVKNHMYKLFVNVGTANDGGYTRLSTKNFIGLGTSLSSATSSYINNNIIPSFSQTVDISTDKGKGLYYIFTATSNATFIAIPYTSQYNCTNCYQYSYGLEIEDVGDTSGLSSSEINNITNNQTSILQADINNLQQDFSDTMNDIFGDCEITNLFNPTTDIEYDGQYRNYTNGRLYANSNFYSIKVAVEPNTEYITESNLGFSEWSNLAFFTSDMQYISGLPYNTEDKIFTTPSNCSYVTIALPRTYTTFIFRLYKTICNNKLDSLNENQQITNDKLDNLNDNITNSDSSEATGEASDFFSNFNTDTFGLTSVITAPLELIKSITSKTCTPLQGTLPFVNTDINLPCLSTIYENYFGSFLTIYRTITFGFVSYWVCIKIFNLVKDFKNPEHDEIEVLDL